NRIGVGPHAGDRRSVPPGEVDGGIRPGPDRSGEVAVVEVLRLEPRPGEQLLLHGRREGLDVRTARAQHEQNRQSGDYVGWSRSQHAASWWWRRVGHAGPLFRTEETATRETGAFLVRRPTRTRGCRTLQRRLRTTSSRTACPARTSTATRFV